MQSAIRQEIPAPGNTISRIAFLDYLRIFSFTTVFIGHKFHSLMTEWAAINSENALINAALETILFLSNGGNVGVIIFFLISGYIITHVLQNESTCSFLIKRIFRIYPLYILAVTCQYMAIDDELPSFSILFSQLTLTGDLIRAPYTLNGIEWTLRIEMYFYVFMAILNSLGFTSRHEKYLPAILFCSVLLCGWLAPLPSYAIWTKGYFTTYVPFLLTGSAAYLAQQGKLNKALFLLLFPATIICTQYWSLLAQQKPWTTTTFAAVAITMFIGSMLANHRISATPFITRLADITYAFYLFHHWFFDYAREVFSHLEIAIFSELTQQTLAVFLIAYLANLLVEKPFIYFGKKVSVFICKKNVNG